MIFNISRIRRKHEFVSSSGNLVNATPGFGVSLSFLFKQEREMCFRGKVAVITQEVNMASIFYYQCRNRTYSFHYSVKRFLASNTGSNFLLFLLLLLLLSFVLNLCLLFDCFCCLFFFLAQDFNRIHVKGFHTH